MKEVITQIYSRYGFELEKHYHNENVLVFLLQAGYFKNVDIVPLNEKADTTKAFTEFSEAGHACSIRKFSSAEEIEKNLFDGFFSIESNRNRLRNDYKKFTQTIVEPFGEHASYTFLNAPYFIDGKPGAGNIVEEILKKTNSDKPILFLIEAAAGFGKTCSAYELVSQINEMDGKIPLFAELSRNRQARIFKHILLDEIDRTFPLLSSKLVQKEIINGRVLAILDGFDELLRDGDSNGELDNKEPMLETIGEYLKGSAKIVLTTRRTILFDGDEFHRWAEKNESEFSLIKIRIGEPRVNDWISEDRLSRLRTTNIEINNIANPVLLSYLRCISEEQFNKICENPEQIVESYFSFMLEREKTRQELPLDIESQHKILDSITEDMIDFEYKSEDRDYIIDLILEKNPKLIEDCLQNYPAATRPTKEELANKLASHALLDKNSKNPNKIGFVNEFVLGNYVARNILKNSNWLNDNWGFIEPAALSYNARTNESRLKLWKNLHATMDFLSTTNKVYLSTTLQKKINFPIIDGEIYSISISNLPIGEDQISNVLFNECIFTNCEFIFSNIEETTFLGCTFYNCTIKDQIPKGNIYLLGEIGDVDFINTFKSILRVEEENLAQEENNYSSAEKSILEKFWPVGRDTITYKHRPIKGVCIKTVDHSPEELYKAITSLKKKKILLEPRSASFVEINFEKINEIKTALGR